MPLTELYDLDEHGKVLPGVTRWRDTQTGDRGVVYDVVSGRMPTPFSTRVTYGSSAGRCALFGGPRYDRDLSVIR